jgi:hypothetical protein
MALVSQREYARRRGLTKTAVLKRTVAHGGPIPTHGPRKQIDEAEADALYEATMAPNGAATSRFRSPTSPGTSESPSTTSADARSAARLGSTLVQARTAMLLTEAQLRRLQLEERRGLVINRQAELGKAFALAWMMRDAILAWPACAGPELAAQFELDERAVTVALEDLLRMLLEQLAHQRPEF